MEIERERPLLTNDAVPTVFPDAPSYMSKSLPRKRKERNLCDQPLPAAKRQKGVCLEKENSAEPTQDGESEEAWVAERPGVSFGNLKIPQSWSKITLPSCLNVFQYAECESDASGEESRVAFKKMVKVEVTDSRQDERAVATVYLNGKKSQQKEVATPEEAEALINDVNRMTLCLGAGLHPVAGKCSSFNGKFFSKKCVFSYSQRSSGELHSLQVSAKANS